MLICILNKYTKKIQKCAERFCVNVIFLTSPRRFSTNSYQCLHFGPNFQSMSTPWIWPLVHWICIWICSASKYLCNMMFSFEVCSILFLVCCRVVFPKTIPLTNRHNVKSSLKLFDKENQDKKQCQLKERSFCPCLMYSHFYCIYYLFLREWSWGRQLCN